MTHAKSLADYNQGFIIRRYSSIEGGYVFDPKDLGGETNHGITKALAETPHVKKYLVELFKWNGKMKDLTKEMAFVVYQREFWNKLQCDQFFSIHPLLADKVFDVGINGGRARIGRFVQEFVNALNNEGKLYPDIKLDGDIGGKTIDAVKSFLKSRPKDGMVLLINNLISRQESHYIDISIGREANERFTFGWLMRAHESRLEYQRIGNLWG